MIRTIHVTMRDELTDEEIVREIDGSNFLVIDGEVSRITRDPELQRELLLEWIAERAEPQHDTLLQLVSWYMIEEAA